MTIAAMNTLRRITNRLRDEWDYATPLARLAMVAAPLLLVTTLVLAGVVGAAYYGFATYGGADSALELPTAAPGTPTPEPTPIQQQPRGGITRQPTD